MSESQTSPTFEPVTCSNFVERRTGAGITTGAGPRSGLKEVTCGKPAGHGPNGRYCKRCASTVARRREATHARLHTERTSYAIRTGTSFDPTTDCPICKRQTSTPAVRPVMI